MRKLSVIPVLVLWWVVAGSAQAQTTGLCDTTPKTYVATNGMVQVRYNVKTVTLMDMDGKSRTAYSYDYATVDKLDKETVDKALSPAVADSIKAVPLVVSKEPVLGYNGPDKAAYEAKFNAVETDPIKEAPVDEEPLEKP